MSPLKDIAVEAQLYTTDQFKIRNSVKQHPSTSSLPLSHFQTAQVVLVILSQLTMHTALAKLVTN